MNNNTNFSQPQNSTADSSADLKLFIYKIYQNWKWILLFLIGTIALSVLYVRYASPVYKSRASIMIKDEKKGGGGILDNPLLKELDMSGGGKLVENEIEILQSYDLMEFVVRKEQLFLNILKKGKFVKRSVFDREVPFNIEVQNPDTISLAFNWTLHRNTNNSFNLNYGPNSEINITPEKTYTIDGLLFKISDNPYYHQSPTDSSGESEYLLNFIPVKSAVNRYSKSLAIQAANKTATIINLELRDQNEAKARQALNTLLDVYNNQALEDKNKVTANTLNFLNNRLGIIEGELRSVEGMVQQLKTTNKITDIPAEAQQILDQAKDVDFEKAKQQTQLNLLQSLEENLRNNQDDSKLVPSGSGITDLPLNSLIESHNNLVLQRERQQERLGPKNPSVVDLGNQITNVRGSLIASIGSLKQSFRISLNDLAGKDAQLNAKIQSIPRIEKNLVQINRDQSVKQQIYFLLLQKREEASITLASNTPDSRRIERPRSMGIVSPQRKLVYFIAALFGLLIPIGIIYIMDLLNNKISGKDEVERKCKAPVIGEISYVKKSTSPIVVQKSSRSIVAEQFRAIRTNISFTRAGSSTKNILITSHRPSEGKSFTSLNLAATYALLKKKVVVLEFDLRKPRLSSALNITSEVGISNYLSTPDMKVDAILKEVPDFEKGFWLLPAGPIPPNPTELIISERMEQLMAELDKKFDYIIFDTPPYSLVTDSSLLSKYTDLSIIVLRQGFTFDWVLQEINKKVAESGAHPIYTVINRVGENSYYGNYRRYGYGEYFDAPATKKKWWNIFGK